MITALHQVFGRKYQVPYELIYNFNGNFNEANGINNLVQNGTVTFTTDRKGGNTAIQLGSGNLKTANNLPESPTWSISLWVKNTVAQIGQMFELSSNPEGTQGAFTFGNWGANNFRILETIDQNHKSAPNNVSTSIYNETNWHHVVLILDKNQTNANDEIKLYLDGVQQTLYVVNGQNNNTTGNFISNILYIGGRGDANQYSYKGALDDVKIFNKPLTQTEITNLYNE